MSPRARQAPPPVPPAPGAEPPPAPAPPGLEFKSIQCRGGWGVPPLPPASAAGPRSALPQGLGTRRPRLPALPEPRSPARGLRAGALEGADPRPGVIGSRRGPQGAEEGGGGLAPRRLRRQKMAAWHDPAPRPSPRFPALLGPAGGGHGRPPGAVRRVTGGPGREARRREPPPATCGWGVGCQWSGEGGRGGERAARGAHLPAGGWSGRGRGLVVPGSSPLLPRGRGSRGGGGGGGGGAAVWGRGGAGEHPGPGGGP